MDRAGCTLYLTGLVRRLRRQIIASTPRSGSYVRRKSRHLWLMRPDLAGGVSNVAHSVLYCTVLVTCGTWHTDTKWSTAS